MNNFVVIFDLDYTIWGHQSFKEQCVDIAEYLKIPYSDEFLRQVENFYFGNTLDNVVISKEKVEKLIEIKVPYLTEHNIFGYQFMKAMELTDLPYLFEGTEKLLSFLKQNGYIVIAYTDWYLDYQTYLLEKFGIYNYFDKIYSWDNTYQKPNKERIENVVNEYSDKKFIYIGDSLRDKVSARYIKDCVFICYKNLNLKSDSDYIVNNLEDIIDILKTMNN